MQVILNEDLEGKGIAGEIVTVSNGYARNYLLPRGIAKEATKGNLNAARKQIEAAKIKRERDKKTAQQLAKEMENTVVTITAKRGNAGKLFGAVTAEQIANALNEQHAIEVDKKKFVVPTIKDIGEYDITVKLFPEVSTKIRVNVVDEAEAAKKAAAAKAEEEQAMEEVASADVVLEIDDIEDGIEEITILEVEEPDAK